MEPPASINVAVRANGGQKGEKDNESNDGCAPSAGPSDSTFSGATASILQTGDEKSGGGGSSIKGMDVKITQGSRRGSQSISPPVTLALDIAVHALCLALYVIPICFCDHPHGATPTLDEIHIMGGENADIRGSSRWQDVFLNDYWGRRMDNPSSHKSWRPLTVLSFRWLKGLYTHQELTTHRVVNVVTHGAVADLVGRLGERLWWSATEDSTWIRLLVKLVFALHPTHVEAAANAANRNHLLAVLMSLLASDPTVGLPWTILALVGGFLCSETFVFQIPAILVTNVVLRYSDEMRARQKNCNETKRNTRSYGFPKNDGGSEPSMPAGLIQTVVWYLHCVLAVLPRVLLVVLVTFTYLGGRHYFDTLSIPDGLIRPAENPFAEFEGEHRARNYLYVLAIHIGKSWGLDPIGFSHEYGRDCVSPLNDWNDERLKLPLGIAVAMISASAAILTFRPVTLSGPLLVHWAWLLTLLPISGLFKVGTFISDRIVIASTVSVAIWIGCGLHKWWTKWIHSTPAAPLQALAVGWLAMTSYRRVHVRTMEWMDSTTLIASSLVNCPRFGKAHMEASKLHSGMYPELLDFDKSLEHLRIAEKVDPDLCDVNLQFAYIAIQQGRYEEYEDRLTQAVMCPFSMGGALPQWQQYWKVTMNSAQDDPEALAEVQRRHDHYAGILQRAVEAEQEKERLKKTQQG